MTSVNKIRFAVLIDSDQLKNWQIDCIQLLLEDSHNDFIGFIKTSTIDSFNSKKLSAGFRWLERQTRKKRNFQSQAIESVFKSSNIIEVATTKKGIYTILEKNDIDKLESLECDFFLRFGFGIIGGELLDIPKHGVWSFHHGDPEEFRGGPPSFWEFIKKKKNNGFVLQKLTNALDGGEIISEGRIAIWSHSYYDHLDRLFDLSKSLVKQASRKLFYQGRLSTKQPDKKGKLYKAPKNIDVLMLYLKVYKSKLYFHYIQLFKGEVWNIGVAQNISDENGRFFPTEIDWMPLNKKQVYHADPFYGKDNTIYFEEYDYNLLKANISKVNYSNSSWNDKVVYLDKEFHLSYPFYVKAENKSFIIPEQYQSNAVVLYELDLENKISNTHSLIEGNWVDPTLFHHNGFWWLFVSPQPYSNECLHVFYSEKIYGPYKPHLLNPVKIDIQSARGGGLPYKENEQIIRPSQNSEFGYGSSIKLNYINKLSPTEFEENTFREIVPNPNSKFNEALHTFSINEGQYLIDGKYTTFIYSSFFSQLKRKTKRLLNIG